MNDPAIVNELYVTHNRVVDKYPKFGNTMKSLFGNSILVQPSNEQWALKRKHLSAAFYKDKMSPMLGMMIDITFDSLKQLKETHLKTGTPVEMVEYISAHLMSCIL